MLISFKFSKISKYNINNKLKILTLFASQILVTHVSYANPLVEVRAIEAEFNKISASHEKAIQFQRNPKTDARLIALQRECNKNDNYECVAAITSLRSKMARATSASRRELAQMNTAAVPPPPKEVFENKDLVGLNSEKVSDQETSPQLQDAATSPRSKLESISEEPDPAIGAEAPIAKTASESKSDLESESDIELKTAVSDEWSPREQPRAVRKYAFMGTDSQGGVLERSERFMKDLGVVRNHLEVGRFSIRETLDSEASIAAQRLLDKELNSKSIMTKLILKRKKLKDIIEEYEEAFEAQKKLMVNGLMPKKALELKKKINQMKEELGDFLGTNPEVYKNVRREDLIAVPDAELASLLKKKAALQAAKTAVSGSEFGGAHGASAIADQVVGPMERLIDRRIEEHMMRLENQSSAHLFVAGRHGELGERRRINLKDDLEYVSEEVKSKADLLPDDNAAIERIRSELGKVKELRDRFPGNALKEKLDKLSTNLKDQVAQQLKPIDFEKAADLVTSGTPGVAFFKNLKDLSKTIYQLKKAPDRMADASLTIHKLEHDFKLLSADAATKRIEAAKFQKEIGTKMETNLADRQKLSLDSPEFRESQKEFDLLQQRKSDLEKMTKKLEEQQASAYQKYRQKLSEVVKQGGDELEHYHLKAANTFSGYNKGVDELMSSVLKQKFPNSAAQKRAQEAKTTLEKVTLPNLKKDFEFEVQRLKNEMAAVKKMSDKDFQKKLQEDNPDLEKRLFESHYGSDLSQADVDWNLLKEHYGKDLTDQSLRDRMIEKLISQNKKGLKADFLEEKIQALKSEKIKKLRESKFNELLKARVQKERQLSIQKYNRDIAAHKGNYGNQVYQAKKKALAQVLKEYYPSNPAQPSPFDKSIALLEKENGYTATKLDHLNDEDRRIEVYPDFAGMRLRAGQESRIVAVFQDLINPGISSRVTTQFQKVSAKIKRTPPQDQTQRATSKFNELHAQFEKEELPPLGAPYMDSVQGALRNTFRTIHAGQSSPRIIWQPSLKNRRPSSINDEQKIPQPIEIEE